MALLPDRGYGWDPVITDEHVFWMDNGRNRTDHTMLGSGARVEPGAAVVGAPGRRRGALGRDQRAPVWHSSRTRRDGIPSGEIVVAYDAGNAVVRAWRVAG